MDSVRDYLEACQTACRHHEAAAAMVAHAVSDVDQRPDDPIPFYDLARVAELCGRMDLWQRGVTIAFALPHDAPKSLYHRGCAKRKLGDWSGWLDHEARWSMPWPPAIGKSWRGLSWTAKYCEGVDGLSSKTLLVVDEGGFGDNLHSLCFIRPLAALAGRVIIMAKPKLVSLVEHNFGDVVDVVASNAAESQLRARFDEYVWSGSVPVFFDGIPPFEPIFAPRPLPRSTFAAERLQIGLCWAATDYPERRLRSRRSLSDLALLEATFRIPGIQWHSLQAGPGATDAESYPVIRPPTISLESFSDTANLIAGLDAVVTIDTSLAHLAGRMGVMTFLLLPLPADDRWELANTTAWYPSMRLVRQRQPGDWASAIELLANQLQALTVGCRALEP